jgi:hypothetical protein
MRKQIPLGIADFKKIIHDEYYYIDKSLFIKDIVCDGAEVILFPRPRRFGKTLNMSMLKYFFEKTEEDNRYLFKELNIQKHKDIMDKQGKYPVIYLTFKDVKSSSYAVDYNKVKELIAEEYRRHKYLLEGDTLDEGEKEFFKDILNCTTNAARIELSLKYLSKFMQRYYKEKCIILIDEYDVPIQSGYINGYYNEVINFMRNFLSAGLKDNIYLEKGVLTGILRVARESIFSGLNNLQVCSLIGNAYSQYFGFTEEEVEKIVEDFQCELKLNEIKSWYNGYIFGEKTIYNPWSILNFVKNKEVGLKPYWVNTSSNDLVKMVLTQGGEKVKTELEELIQGGEIYKNINEDIVMADITKGSQNVWSFLLFSGYLKVMKKEYKKGVLHCQLKIPNFEVEYLYREIIIAWFDESINNDKFGIMLESLVNGDIETFEIILKQFVQSSVSYFDISGEESEKVYHAFVLGMLVSLEEDYEVKSNRESGYGRYDVMLIPKDKSKNGIIFEFKKINKYKNESLEKACDVALKQVKEKKYRQELIDRGIQNIIELGVAFEGKNVMVKVRED